MLLGVIADDFTGAGDVANTLAREGMRTRLFVGDADLQPGACEAGVIALKSRSIPSREAVAGSLAALERLLAAGCRQILFKYCSTFDSTREGNIGPVAEALAYALGVKGVIVCPAFPATGRTVYMGQLFVDGALLSESGMAHHPLNPMVDADLCRWLGHQTALPPGHLRHDIVRRGADAIARALTEQAQAGRTLVVVDAIDEGDLRAIGSAARAARLLTGASGIALGLPANFREAGLLTGDSDAFGVQAGRALVLSGSCSTATREQVRHYRSDAPSLEIDPDRLLTGQPVLAEAMAFVEANAEAAPLLYATADPDRVAAAQARHGSEHAAQTIEQLFGDIARHAVASGVRRIVVAGGETSGAIVTALGLSALDLGPEIAPGVPALSGTTADGAPLALALKSGNFGSPDFFARALAKLGGVA